MAAVAAVKTQRRRAVWPYVDTHTLRFDDNGQQHCSWVMLLPQGTYQHPTYGEIDLSHATLAEIKKNFDERARGIDIALDYDHRASDGDSKAPGWIKEVRLCDAGTSPRGVAAAAPGGLWGLIQWTELGLHDVQAHIYRYISAEFKTDYTNDITGQHYHNVLLGATLTNRPFMKNMPAIALAEVSNKSWASVNKSKLPRSCFLVQGDPDHKETWKLPVYEGAGALDADGHYTKRGALNLNAVRAALAALGGARTGKAMTGVPAGTKARLERLLAKYGGGDSEGDRMATEPEALDEQETDDEQFADASDEDAEAFDAADGDGPDDEPDGDEEEDDDDGFDPESDTHGAMTVRSHAHGKYARHGHEDDGDHSEAPIAKKKAADKRGGRKMSEQGHGGSLTLAEAERQLAEYKRQLAEHQAKEQVQTIAKSLPEGIKLSKVAREKVVAFLSGAAVKLSEQGRDEALDVVQTLLSERALIDTRPHIAHRVNEMEDVTRRTFASVEERGAAFMEMVAQREYKLSADELRQMARRRDVEAQRKLARVIELATAESSAAAQ